MLITFKSKAAGDIAMFAEHADQLLRVMGKSLGPDSAPRGIITALEVAGALAKLQAAADQARAEQRLQQDQPQAHLTVSLAQRAYPLLEMLERAAKKSVDITWGV